MGRSSSSSMDSLSGVATREGQNKNTPCETRPLDFRGNGGSKRTPPPPRFFGSQRGIDPSNIPRGFDQQLLNMLTRHWLKPATLLASPQKWQSPKRFNRFCPNQEYVASVFWFGEPYAAISLKRCQRPGEGGLEACPQSLQAKT